jgi:hypothetical protein
MTDLDPVTLLSLQHDMQQFNPYAQTFVTAGSRARNGENVRIIIKGDRNDRRRNAPTASEVAAITVDTDVATRRDIIVFRQDRSIWRIPELHPAYDPLQYPLIFPRGEDGWHLGIPHASGTKSVTAHEFYSHRLHTFANQEPILHRFGRLFHQYAVDASCKIDDGRLCWMRNNQTKLRAETYAGFADALRANTALSQVGLPVVLPSTFIGGPRYMAECYQDAMAIVRQFGSPDLFVTFTCNPEWPEIKDAILENQIPNDRPDIVARVFRLKLKSLLDDLTKKSVLGKVVAHMHVIEFQKRGLPHAHILVCLA